MRDSLASSWRRKKTGGEGEGVVHGEENLSCGVAMKTGGRRGRSALNLEVISEMSAAAIQGKDSDDHCCYQAYECGLVHCITKQHT